VLEFLLIEESSVGGRVLVVEGLAVGGPVARFLSAEAVLIGGAAASASSGNFIYSAGLILISSSYCVDSRVAPFWLNY
jgi:hypothetical protein